MEGGAIAAFAPPESATEPEKNFSLLSQYAFDISDMHVVHAAEIEFSAEVKAPSSLKKHETLQSVIDF